jgi:hypothetical protein
LIFSHIHDPPSSLSSLPTTFFILLSPFLILLWRGCEGMRTRMERQWKSRKKWKREEKEEM